MKLKSLILTVCLSLFALSGLLAQEKYEYAILKQFNSTIVFATKEKSTEVKPLSGEDIYVTLLKKVSELNDEGWEVYTNTEVINNSWKGITYYLRKKKN